MRVCMRVGAWVRSHLAEVSKIVQDATRAQERKHQSDHDRNESSTNKHQSESDHRKPDGTQHHQGESDHHKSTEAGAQQAPSARV